MQPNNLRKHYLDNIRWVTILLVVIFHIFYYYNNIGIEPMFKGLAKYEGAMTFAGIYQYVVYPWFMVLLFIVSGISARFALKKATNKQFMKARVDKVLVPSTLGILAFGWIGGYIIYLHNASQSMPANTPGFVAVIISLLSGIGALWFCQLLFVAVLVLLFVRFIIRKCNGSDEQVFQFFSDKMNSYAGFIFVIVVAFLILWGGSHVLNMPVVTSYRNGIYIPAFLMGYYIFSTETMMEKLKQCMIPSFVLTVVTGVLYIHNCYGTVYSDIGLLSRVDTNLYAFFMILFIFGFMASCFDKCNGFTSYMSKCCFGIYVFHIPVLLVTNFFLEKAGVGMALVYILELVSALVISVVLYEVVRRIPWVRYWILGMRGKKK